MLQASGPPGIPLVTDGPRSSVFPKRMVSLFHLSFAEKYACRACPVDGPISWWKCYLFEVRVSYSDPYMRVSTRPATLHSDSAMPPDQSSIEEEFLAAYDQYADAIFRHCYFRVFDRERGKDLMQEVFMRAFLYRIANNLIVDESRKKKEASLEKMQEDGFDPGVDDTGAWKNRIDRDKILAKLGDIDESYRNILVMRFINDLSPAEIAEITGDSANTISVRIYRGLKQLRSLINDAQQ